MAIYDRDATPATAVTAFLAQFKIATNGDITYVSGSDTFHVWWLHRSLQKIAWDFVISGDDEINLAKPNPSTSEALGTIITLKDWTTDFSVSYNITDEVAEYLFGGSVEQGASGAITRFSGLIVLGSVNLGTTELQIIQNATLLTSHWGTGKNQTDASTLLRILIKTHVAGTETDLSLVTVKAHEWYDTNSIWETGLGLGEKVAAINTSGDPQNDTLLVTVQGYSITPSQGYKLLDIDGNGDKPFLGEWDYGAYNKKALYEFVKAMLVRGTADTLFGVDGDLWTNRVYDCVIGSGSGTWVEGNTPDTLSWGTGDTAGTGHLMGVDTTTGGSTARLILHLDTGVFPANTLTITGAGAATGVVSGTPAKLSAYPTHLGQFTGSWIGAYGIGFVPGQLTSTDSVTDLDGNPVTVPNNVNIQITVETGLAGDDPRVFLTQKDAVLTAPDYNTYDGETTSSGLGYLDVDAPIESDVPSSGYVCVLHTGDTAFTMYPYSSWNNTDNTPNGRFILDAVTLGANVVAGDDVFVPIIYASATGGGTTKVISNSLIYNGDIDVIGWVRHGDPAAPDKPVPIAGTIGTAGLSLTVVLDDES